MTTTELEPIDPTDAVETYLQTRRDEIADATYTTQRSRLTYFAEWCHDNGIEDLTELSGRDLNDYNLHLRDRLGSDDEPVNHLTLKTRLSTIRVFLRFCESIDAVHEGLYEKVIMPTVERGERSRDDILPADRAETILAKLREYRYGSREHVVFALLWRTGCRIGVVHALDTTDVDFDNNRLEVNHRPETDTPIKNGAGGERIITLDGQLIEAIDVFVTVNRPPVTDEHGRDPLFTTRNGRAAKSTVRNWVYKAQMPCFYANECPHGKDIPDCEHRSHHERKNCPSTTMPHNIRRGAITHFLSEDIPTRAISDRADVSDAVLSEHYDKRSKEDKAEQRRQFFT